MSDPEKSKRSSPESAATPPGPQSHPAPGKVDEYVWQVAQLATSLLCGLASPGQVPPKGWVWYEKYFKVQVDNALQKARVILDRASRPETDRIQLHEFFRPGEDLNSNQILKNLKTIEWWSTTRPTMDDRLEFIRSKWTARVCALRDDFSDSQTKPQQAVFELERMLDEFCKRDGMKEILPQAAEHSRVLLSELYKFVRFSDYEVRTVKYEREKSLFDWCFRTRGGSNGKASPSKRYRFHELLRVAEANGWLPDEFADPVGPIFAKLAGLPPFYAIPIEASFEAFNSDGVKSSLTHYPWQVL